METTMPIFVVCFIAVGFIATFTIIIGAIVCSVKLTKARKEFIATHKIKCKRCGSTDTVYICMVTESYSSGEHSSRSTTHYGHDKFCCNKCKANHYIENGDWIDDAGNNCNDEAKRLGLYR